MTAGSDENQQLRLPLLAADMEPEGSGEEAPVVASQIAAGGVTWVKARSILTPASGFAHRYKFTLNPYRGCRFGCEYCYARFFAPTLDEQEGWGSWLSAKENAVELVHRAVSKTKGARQLLPGDTIYMSTVTDPYQPAEKRLELTRSILRALLPVQPRLTIQTRSPLVVRDIDLLNQFDHIRVNFTITTDAEKVRLRYEPHCPAIRVRLEAANTLRKAGVPIGISISPMLPIHDREAFGRRIARLNAAEYVTQYLKPSRSRFRAGSSVRAHEMLRADGWTEEQYHDTCATLQRLLGGERQLLKGAEGYAPPD